MLIEGCFLHQAHEAQDSVKEIEAELLKALLHFGRKEDRLKFLTSLKMALGFHKVLKHKDSSSLTRFVHEACFDTTLYYSHKSLHG